MNLTRTRTLRRHLHADPYVLGLDGEGRGWAVTTRAGRTYRGDTRQAALLAALKDHRPRRRS